MDEQEAEAVKPPETAPTWKVVAVALAAIVMALAGTAALQILDRQAKLESRVTAIEISFAGISSTISAMSTQVSEVKSLLEKHMERNGRQKDY